MKVIRDENHMATTFELRISCSMERVRHAEEALRECHALIAKLESELTEFSPESPVARLNVASPSERIALGESGFRLIQEALRLEELSGGAFSPAAKSQGGGSI